MNVATRIKVFVLKNLQSFTAIQIALLKQKSKRFALHINITVCQKNILE